MALTVSVEKAAENALAVWIKSQLSDVAVSSAWPDPGKAFPDGGAVTILGAGACDETPVRPPQVLKVVNDAPPAVTANFYFRTHFCEQALQLDVWATSVLKRDDIVNRLGDALTAGKLATLGAQFFIDEGIWSNQDPVEQSITLKLAAPWDHLVAAYTFEAPERTDSPAAAKRVEFRASYRGTAFFDRTVIRNLPRLVNPTTPVSTHR